MFCLRRSVACAQPTDHCFVFYYLCFLLFILYIYYFTVFPWQKVCRAVTFVCVILRTFISPYLQQTAKWSLRRLPCNYEICVRMNVMCIKLLDICCGAGVWVLVPSSKRFRLKIYFDHLLFSPSFYIFNMNLECWKP